MTSDTLPPRVTARRALAFCGVAAFFVVLLALVHVTAQALLLTFAGALFACALRGVAQALADRTGWHVQYCLALCVVALLLLAVLAGLWIVPNIGARLGELMNKLEHAYRVAGEALRGSSLQFLLPDGSGSLQALTRYIPRIAGFLASGAGALGAVLVVMFLALYFATDPQAYERGLVRLVPPSHRKRMTELLGALARTLRRWLLGRAVSMVAVGVTTAVGLWLLGIPLPLTLGLIAGILGFVPNLGPIASAAPALLLATTVDPLHVLYVLILYLAINLLDGYVLTPWIQKRAVSVPPALILTSQLVFGALWGLLGVTFATPLIACAIVIIRRLYVRDVLEAPAHARAAAVD